MDIMFDIKMDILKVELLDRCLHTLCLYLLYRYFSRLFKVYIVVIYARLPR